MAQTVSNTECYYSFRCSTTIKSGQAVMSSIHADLESITLRGSAWGPGISSCSSGPEEELELDSFDSFAAPADRVSGEGGGVLKGPRASKVCMESQMPTCQSGWRAEHITPRAGNPSWAGTA